MISCIRTLFFFTSLVGMASPVAAQGASMFAGVKIVIHEAKYDLTFTDGEDAYGHEILALSKEVQGVRQDIQIGPNDKARLQSKLKGIERIGYRLKAIEMDWGGDIPQVEVEIKSGVNFIHFRDFKARVVAHRAYATLCQELERLAN